MNIVMTDVVTIDGVASASTQPLNSDNFVYAEENAVDTDQCYIFIQNVSKATLECWLIDNDLSSVQDILNGSTNRATGKVHMKLETLKPLVNKGSGYEINSELDAVGGTYVDVMHFNTTKVQPINAQTASNYDGVDGNGTFDGGADYDVADHITLSDGTILTVGTVDEDGVVLTFTVNSTGSTGTTDNHDTLTQSSTDGTGTGFTLTLGTPNQAINTLAVLDYGDYTVLPSNVAVVQTICTNGDGTGCVINVDFEVDSVEVVNPGSDYVTATATFSSGTAAATVVIETGAVASFTITNPGDNYVTIPTVTVSLPNDVIGPVVEFNFYKKSTNSTTFPNNRNGLVNASYIYRMYQETGNSVIVIDSRNLLDKLRFWSTMTAAEIYDNLTDTNALIVGSFIGNNIQRYRTAKTMYYSPVFFQGETTNYLVEGQTAARMTDFKGNAEYLIKP